MAAQRLETSGQIRSKYNILLVLEAIKYASLSHHRFSTDSQQPEFRNMLKLWKSAGLSQS